MRSFLPLRSACRFQASVGPGCGGILPYHHPHHYFFSRKDMRSRAVILLSDPPCEEAVKWGLCIGPIQRHSQQKRSMGLYVQ